MAATAEMMKTWTCPNRGVFYSWTCLLLVLVNAVEVVVAAPETGLWKITVVNVSTLIKRMLVDDCSGGLVTLLAELALSLLVVVVDAV